MTFRLKGEDEEREKAGAFLMKAFGTALFLIFAILLAQFNKFISVGLVLTAVILSTIGVLIGLMVMGQPFGVVMTGIGVIANAGVIVNNNIVLIDTYDRLRREGVAAYDAIIETCRERARPVVLTAVTAILGVLPIAFGMNIEFMTREITIGAPATQWWISLSTAIVFGLGFATMLTLVVTPAALMAIANIAAWRERRRARRAERTRRAPCGGPAGGIRRAMPLDPTPLVAKTPVIPVLTIERTADAVPLARALVAGGLPVIEVTLRTKAALDAIKAIAAEVPDCVVGVGTVTRVADIAAAISAGAKYLVSPGTPPELAAALADAPVPGVARMRHGLRGDGARRARLQGAEVLPRRSLRRHGVAEIRRGAAARDQVLPDRRHRREEHRGIPRLPERARGRRLVGRAEGCDRGRRFRPHHAARARGVRAARRRMSATGRASGAPSTGRPPSSRRSRSALRPSCSSATGRRASSQFSPKISACSARCCRRCWPAA